MPAKAFLFARDWMFQLHARWFRLTPELFDAMHYGGLGLYKLAIWLLNLAPYNLEWLMAKKTPKPSK